MRRLRVDAVSVLARGPSLKEAHEEAQRLGDLVWSVHVAFRKLGLPIPQGTLPTCFERVLAGEDADEVALDVVTTCVEARAWRPTPLAP